MTEPDRPEDPKSVGAAKAAPSRARTRKAPGSAKAAPRRSTARSAAVAAAPSTSPSIEAETTPTVVPEPPPVVSASPSARRSGLALITDPTSVVPVYAGVVAVVAGFALIFISWSLVAGQSSVWLQMPFLLSTGFPGLGLIMAGLVLVNVSVKRQDGARRAAQMSALTEAVTELRRALGEGS